MSGRKISEAKNESTDTFYDPATNRLLLDAKISLCACPCVVSKHLVPGSVEDRPCVSECDTSHVGDNRGAEPYVEHWLCRLSSSTGRLTRFSKFSELLITAQRYAHELCLESLKARSKRFTVRDMAGGRKRRSSTLC